MLKKLAIGFVCGILLLAATAAYASDAVQAIRQVFINGQPLQANVQVAEDGTTMIPARKLAEALGATVKWNEPSNTVEIDNAYPVFVSSLLNEGYSFNVEVIPDPKLNKPDTTVVYAEGYKQVPGNTNFQKLFILLLVDQLGDGIKSKQIEFWSDKDRAISYVTGNYENDGLEGWTGMNSRFAILTKDGEKASLQHILSTHERDDISLGKYKSE